MKTLLPIALLIILIIIGCLRGGGNPAIPPENNSLLSEPVTVQNNRILLGVGEVNISADRQTVEIIPNRNTEMHLNILPFIEQCSGCILFSDFIVYSPTDFSVDVKLKHPLPNLPQYTVFDMRFIFITDADYTFPGSGVDVSFEGSNPLILNPSGYTRLFNPTDFPYNPNAPIFNYYPGIVSMGSNFSATINPFIAFGKENPRRMISSGEEDHRRVRLNVPTGPLHFGYAVDACWKESAIWDNPVDDFPPEANCTEAYMINVDMDQWPVSSDDIEPVIVTVYDHQGASTIGNVTAEAPGLFSGVIELTQSAEWENSAEYTGTITNDLGGTIYDSPMLIRVTDTHVDEFFGHVDAWLVVSGTAFAGPEEPNNPIEINDIDTPSNADGVAVSGGYAYVADTLSGLQVIDVDPPLDAFTVQAVDTPGLAYGVAVSGGYAYVADYYYGLQIIDIDPPAEAAIVKFVVTPYSPMAVVVSAGYAYVVDYYTLKIIDIDPIDSAYIVKSVNIPGKARGIAVSGGYAYIADDYPGLEIVDIDPLSSAYIVSEVFLPEGACDVAVSGSYAYVADKYSGLQIVNINPPSLACIVNSVDTPGKARGIEISGGYAYIADWDSGLQIIDINPISSAYIFSSLDTPGFAYDVAVLGGYAYVADDTFGLRIIKLW
ncbi:MAG: hypothetical protein NTY09_04095 [bacterium]|nr:hypothetical protein [bacterium]